MNAKKDEAGVSATGFHIPTVDEGLLSTVGCYIGAYLGGNQGSNNNMCVNYYCKAQVNPYEIQILDHPDNYGEKKLDNNKPGELEEIDTGIEKFRAGVEILSSGSGKKQLLFSRYYDMTFYPDNNYGKIQYIESCPPDIWVEKVLMQGGVPVLILYPWSLQKNGVLDLSAQNSYHEPMTGTEIMTEIAVKLDELSKKYAVSNGKPATILICFGLEFNAQSIVNPTGIDNVDNANKQAWRRMFRDAYNIVQANANPSVQMVWSGNVSQTKDDRIYYWPGTDDNGNPMNQDYVDWVGMTWYPWNNGPTKLDDFSGFYDYYAKEQNHPMIFMETSADGDGVPKEELKLKKEQVEYLYNKSNLTNYPNIKGIIWFNVIKGENNKTKNFLIPDGGWNNNDKSTTIPGFVYSASDSGKTMLSSYPEAVSDPYFLGP